MQKLGFGCLLTAVLLMAVPVLGQVASQTKEAAPAAGQQGWPAAISPAEPMTFLEFLNSDWQLEDGEVFPLGEGEGHSFISATFVSQAGDQIDLELVLNSWEVAALRVDFVATIIYAAYSRDNETKELNDWLATFIGELEPDEGAITLTIEEGLDSPIQLVISGSEDIPDGKKKCRCITRTPDSQGSCQVRRCNNNDPCIDDDVGACAWVDADCGDGTPVGMILVSFGLFFTKLSAPWQRRPGREVLK